VFAIFGGFFYWYPLFTGLAYNVQLGKLHFYTTFFRVNLTFFPQHFLGLAGMPRRYADHLDCFVVCNKIRSIGSTLTVFRVLLFVVILWERLVACRPVQVRLVRRTNLEWARRFPLAYHTHGKPAKLFTAPHKY
jgi:cytochrome c oxidase subunit 1